MRHLWANLRGSVLRVVPACFTQAQAVAFNMFLAFFPLLLLALGVLESSEWLKGAALELPSRLQQFLPPGSGRLISQFIQRLDRHPAELIFLGLGGILLVGTQVMMGLMEGFRIAAGQRDQPSFWRRYARALLLLSLTIVPWLATFAFTVFAKTAREWIVHQVGEPVLVRAVWLALYYGTTFVVGSLVLVVVYKVSQPWCFRWGEAMPGAIVATILWWILNAGFGFYYRHMPYNMIYGSLAVVIGLMVWMYFTALVLMVGSAYNAMAAANATSETFVAPEIITQLRHSFAHAANFARFRKPKKGKPKSKIGHGLVRP